MKMRKWIEINLKEKYVIYEDEPKKKYPLKDGEIILDLNKNKLKIKIETDRGN